MGRRPDPEQLAYTRQNDLVLITKNPRDFEALHRELPDHPGILAIYQDNRPSDMSDADIARAVQNLIDAEVTLANAFLALNAWNY